MIPKRTAIWMCQTHTTAAQMDLSRCIKWWRGRGRSCWRVCNQLYNHRMSALQEAERFLSSLNRAEKAQVLQWVARDLGDSFPGIDTIPNVSGGEPCIVRTRIPVWILVQARKLGTTESNLLEAYPTLRA